MKNLYLGIMLLATCSCSYTTGDSGELSVAHHGVLREIMMEQKLDANADLASFSSTPHLYALGALEGLSGEIMIIDSKSFLAVADSSGLNVEQGFDRKATLLVTSQVESWQEYSLDLEWTNMEGLQMIVDEVARQQGIPKNRPFPFLLKGTFDQLSWHVINASMAKEQNHEAYKKAGASGESNQISGQILGFYSENHEGVFTHHGSYLHLHFISDDKRLMGHVDQLKSEGKIKLFLPKTNAL